MRRRTKLLLLAVVVIALAAVALRPSRPRYRGKSLDYWVQRLSDMSDGAGEYDDQAAAAVRALRTIPEMLQDMDYDGSARRNRRTAILRKLPLPLQRLLFQRAMSDRRQSLEAAAVTILARADTDAAAVIPGLERLVRSTNAAISYRSTFVLLSKGTNGLAAFFKAVHEPGQGDPLRMIANLGKMHEDLWAAETPELTRLSQSEDPDIARAALRTLGKMRAEREAVLARLLYSITNADATSRLIGVSTLLPKDRGQPQIRSALSNALHDPDLDVRAAAARALAVPQVSTNLPTR